MADRGAAARRDCHVAPGCPPDPAPAGPRRCARPSVGWPRHRRLPRRRDARDVARTRAGAGRRRRHRGDHGAARLGRREVRRARRHHPARRSLLVPHRRLHQRDPRRRGDRPGRVGHVVARVGPDRARGWHRRRCSPPRRAAAVPGPAGAVRRDGHRSRQRPRARAQDRGGRAGSRRRPTTSRPCSTAISPGATRRPTRAVLLATDRDLDDTSRRRLVLVARATTELGLPTTVIAPRDTLELLPASVDGVELGRWRRCHARLADAAPRHRRGRPVDDPRAGRRGGHEPRPDPPRARAMAAGRGRRRPRGGLVAVADEQLHPDTLAVIAGRPARAAGCAAERSDRARIDVPPRRRPRVRPRWQPRLGRLRGGARHARGRHLRRVRVRPRRQQRDPRRARGRRARRSPSGHRTSASPSSCAKRAARGRFELEALPELTPAALEATVRRSRTRLGRVADEPDARRRRPSRRDRHRSRGRRHRRRRQHLRDPARADAAVARRRRRAALRHEADRRPLRPAARSSGRPRPETSTGACATGAGRPAPRPERSRPTSRCAGSARCPLAWNARRPAPASSCGAWRRTRGSRASATPAPAR